MSTNERPFIGQRVLVPHNDRSEKPTGYIGIVLHYTFHDGRCLNIQVKHPTQKTSTWYKPDEVELLDPRGNGTDDRKPVSTNEHPSIGQRVLVPHDYRSKKPTGYIGIATTRTTFRTGRSLDIWVQHPTQEIGAWYKPDEVVLLDPRGNGTDDQGVDATIVPPNLDPTKYDDWTRAGWILFRQFAGKSAGFQTWARWSNATSDKDLLEHAKKWASFRELARKIDSFEAAENGPNLWADIMDFAHRKQEPAPDVAWLVEALERIASWPDGGNQAGQRHIKTFAAKTLATYRKQEDEREVEAEQQAGPTPAPADITLSPKVLAFARLMQRKLDENAHKGGWDGETFEYLLDRLHEEVEELRFEAEVRSKLSPALVGAEAADVANYAMMIADNAGALDLTQAHSHHRTHSASSTRR